MATDFVEGFQGGISVLKGIQEIGEIVETQRQQEEWKTKIQPKMKADMSVMYSAAIEAKNALDVAYKNAMASEGPETPEEEANLRALADRAHQLATDAAGQGTDYLMMLRTEFVGNRFATSEIDGMMTQSLDRQKVAAHNAATEAQRYGAELEKEGREITARSNEAIQEEKSNVGYSRQGTDIEIERMRDARAKQEREFTIRHEGTGGTGGKGASASLKLRAETLDAVRDEVSSEEGWEEKSPGEQRARFVEVANERLRDVGLEPGLSGAEEDEAPVGEPPQSAKTQLQIQDLEADLMDAQLIRAELEKSPVWRTGDRDSVTKANNRMRKTSEIIVELQRKLSALTKNQKQEAGVEIDMDLDAALDRLNQKYSATRGPAPEQGQSMAPPVQEQSMTQADPRQVEQARLDLVDQLGREPTEPEIIEHLNAVFAPGRKPR